MTDSKSSYTPMFYLLAGAASSSLAIFLFYRMRDENTKRKASVYSIDDKYYQVMGHAWDHEVKDFKVLYRPLYHCQEKAGSFEAHTLAVSHFSRWESKFKPVDVDQLPPSARSLLLTGPFTADPLWTRNLYQLLTVPVKHTTSGHGTRTHAQKTLVHILGDYRKFIDVCLANLLAAGIDAAACGYEMDHLCYRCETENEYQEVCKALQTFSTLLVEGEIGGRMISTVQLFNPIQHAGFTITCVEIPSPKPGTPYPSGLEHLELVVGNKQDGMVSNKRLLQFMEGCKQNGVKLAFDERAINKHVNADVSVSFKNTEVGNISVKFHNRPLNEVIAYEIEIGMAKAPHN